MVFDTANKRDSVGKTTAKAKCTADITLPAGENGEEVSFGETWSVPDPPSPPTGGTGEITGVSAYNIATRTKITYETPVYTWTPHPAGTQKVTEDNPTNIQFNNLNRGRKNANLYASLKVTCTKKTKKETAIVWGYVDIYYENGDAVDVSDAYMYETSLNNATWTEASNGSSSQTGQCEATADTNKEDVWTRPGLFTDPDEGGGWTVSYNDTIQSETGLSAIWTQKWADHMDKIGHWFNQNDTNVAQDCVKESGDIITAAWYNLCALKIRDYTDGEGSCATVTGGANGTLISAAVINALANNNKKTGEVSAQ